MAQLHPQDIDALRRMIARHKLGDYWFTILGLLSTMVGVVTLLALFIDLIIDGIPRLSWDFFTSFPSRKPEQAGILSAWVGTALVLSLIHI